MIRLHVIQARFGDCLLLEYGESANPCYMLIDGGPAKNYEERLKPALLSILNGRSAIDDIVISHVDNDHIVGVVGLLTDQQFLQNTGQPPLFSVSNIWFNAFNQTIDKTGMEYRIASLSEAASTQNLPMQLMSFTLSGINEGYKVLQRIGKLGISLNKDMGGAAFIAAKDNPVIRRKNMEIVVAGPTNDNLARLQTEWEKWIKKNEQEIAAGRYTPAVAADLDKSIPNLSSIVLLVKADGKTILLTGDCRSDHLQQGLIETGCSADGSIHVDIFKVQHHGSCRNIADGQKFFEEVTADTYIISADGKYHNPDYETLEWIVLAAHKSGRKIKLVLTNETDSSRKLLQKYDPLVYNYEPVIMKQEENYYMLTW